MSGVRLPDMVGETHGAWAGGRGHTLNFLRPLTFSGWILLSSGLEPLLGWGHDQIFNPREQSRLPSSARPSALKDQKGKLGGVLCAGKAQQIQ